MNDSADAVKENHQQFLPLDPQKPEDIKIGSNVVVEFEKASEEMSLPFWRVSEN